MLSLTRNLISTVTETTGSVAMEAEGFRRGLDHLLSQGVDVGVITTDRPPSIRKIIREDCGHIRHEFDPWHVNKSKKRASSFYSILASANNCPCEMSRNFHAIAFHVHMGVFWLEKLLSMYIYTYNTNEKGTYY